MLAVTNTSPLNYLVQLGCVEILPKLYPAIAAPSIVIAELRHEATPENVRRWASSPPVWLEIVDVEPSQELLDIGLHAGEVGAIRLAEIRSATFVILDDSDARIVATRRGLQVTGLLGVLKRAAQSGLVDGKELVERLLKTTFRISPELARKELDIEAR